MSISSSLSYTLASVLCIQMIQFPFNLTHLYLFIRMVDLFISFDFCLLFDDETLRDIDSYFPLFLFLFFPYFLCE